MRVISRVAVLLAACVLAAGIVPAAAQVSVDLHALDKLPGSGPRMPDALGSTPPSDRPAARSTHATHGSSHSHTGHADTHADTHGKSRGTTSTAAAHAGGSPHAAPGATAPPAATPPPATLPVTAPVPAHLAPIVPPTPTAAIPAPQPPVTAQAGGDAMPTGDGMRVTFLPNRFELSPETSEALRHFAAAVPRSDSVTLDVRAYAAPVADDPSAARRLSLSRTLAIRAALLAEGIPSSRIFLRALGGTTDAGPPDRCDIIISRLGAEPAAPGHGSGATASAAAPAGQPASTPPVALGPAPAPIAKP